MAVPTPQHLLLLLPLPPPSSCTFINLTDNPGDGRDKRRNFVRRTVMRDYHQRRKKHHACRDSQGQALRPRTRKQSSTAEEKSRTKSAPSNSHPPSLQPPEPERGEAATQDSRDVKICVDATPQSRCPLEPRSAQLFQPKPWASPQLALISRLIRRYLLGQPVKAAWDVSHVAFVHRRFRDEVDFGCDNPLNRCVRLLRGVFATGKDADSPVAASAATAAAATAAIQHVRLWDMVHEEQERIYAQIATSGRWRLLSGAQAIMLYILLWLRVRSCHDKFPHDHLALLFTLGKIFLSLKTLHLHRDAHSSHLRPIQSWEDWIFQQSCLRVGTVYFVLTLVVTMDIGFACDKPTDWCIENMPLPATKRTWEAGREDFWNAALRGSTGGGVVDALNASIANQPSAPLLFQDMIFRNGLYDVQQRCVIDDSDACDWEEGLDEMGMIVALAGMLYPETKAGVVSTT